MASPSGRKLTDSCLIVKKNPADSAGRFGGEVCRSARGFLLRQERRQGDDREDEDLRAVPVEVELVGSGTAETPSHDEDPEVRDVRAEGHHDDRETDVVEFGRVHLAPIHHGGDYDGRQRRDPEDDRVLDVGQVPAVEHVGVEQTDDVDGDPSDHQDVDDVELEDDAAFALEDH